MSATSTLNDNNRFGHRSRIPTVDKHVSNISCTQVYDDKCKRFGRGYSTMYGNLPNINTQSLTRHRVCFQWK